MLGNANLFQLNSIEKRVLNSFSYIVLLSVKSFPESSHSRTPRGRVSVWGSQVDWDPSPAPTTEAPQVDAFPVDGWDLIREAFHKSNHTCRTPKVLEECLDTQFHRTRVLTNETNTKALNLRAGHWFKHLDYLSEKKGPLPWGDASKHGKDKYFLNVHNEYIHYIIYEVISAPGQWENWGGGKKTGSSG